MGKTERERIVSNSCPIETSFSLLFNVKKAVRFSVSNLPMRSPSQMYPVFPQYSQSTLMPKQISIYVNIQGASKDGGR